MLFAHDFGEGEAPFSRFRRAGDGGWTMGEKAAKNSARLKGRLRLEIPCSCEPASPDSNQKKAFLMRSWMLLWLPAVLVGAAAADPFRDGPNRLTQEQLDSVMFSSRVKEKPLQQESVDRAGFAVALRLSESRYAAGTPVWAYLILKSTGGRGADMRLDVNSLRPTLVNSCDVELHRDGEEKNLVQADKMCVLASYRLLPVERDGYYVVRVDVRRIAANCHLRPGRYRMSWSYARWQSNVVRFEVTEAREDATLLDHRLRLNLLRAGDWQFVGERPAREVEEPAGAERIDADHFAAAIACGVDGVHCVDLLDLPASDARVRMSLSALDENGEPLAAGRMPAMLEVRFTAVGRQVTQVSPEQFYFRIASDRGGMMGRALQQQEEALERLKAIPAAVAPDKPLIVRLPFPKQVNVPTGRAMQAELAVIAVSQSPPLPGLAELKARRLHVEESWRGLLCSNTITIPIPVEWSRQWAAGEKRPRPRQD